MFVAHLKGTTFYEKWGSAAANSAAKKPTSSRKQKAPSQASTQTGEGAGETILERLSVAHT
jgi:hypothetical protein